MSESVPGPLLLVVDEPAGSVVSETTSAHLRHFPRRLLGGRFARWRDHLAGHMLPLPASGGYRCDTWDQLISLHRPPEVLLFLATPTQGLIPADAPLAAATASFAPNHRDTIGASEAEAQEWWQALHESDALGAVRGGLSGLVGSFPHATVLAALRTETLRAVHADVWEAWKHSQDPERFVLLAPQSHGPIGIGPSQIGVSAAFHALLGGALHDQPARLLHHFAHRLGSDHLRASVLQRKTKEMACDLPPTRNTPKKRPATRRKLGGKTLEKFVVGELSRDPLLSLSGLRRSLNDSGATAADAELRTLHDRHSLPLFAG